MNRWCYRSFIALLLFLSTTSFLKSNAPLLIKSFGYQKNIILVYPDKEFVKDYMQMDYFFTEYDKDIDISVLPRTILTIPFIAHVIPMVWASEKTWSINEMDEDFYYCLKKIKKTLKFFYPSLSWSGELEPRNLIKNKPMEQSSLNNERPQIAALFSGGLDAVCTSIRHWDIPQLLITICGSDIQINRHHMWNCVKDRCRQYAQTYDHYNTFARAPFIVKNTHLTKIAPEIQNWWASTMMSLCYLGLAAPLVVLNGLSKLFIGSSYTQDQPFPCGTHPLIDNAVAFASVEVFHDGTDLTRLEKLETIKSICHRHNLPIPYLRVCWGNDADGGNCGKCEKCLRTLNEILAIECQPATFGFDKNETENEIIENTKKLWNGRVAYDNGIAWSWHCIQDYIKNKYHKMIYDDSLKDYFSWLATASFKEIPHRFTQDDKSLYSFLWERSCKRILDYDKL